MRSTPATASSEESENVIEVRDLVTHYGTREILKSIDVDIRKGEIMVVMGGSGSGKSTFLRHIIGLERATSGSIRVLGREIADMTEIEATEFSRKIGSGVPGRCAL